MTKAPEGRKSLRVLLGKLYSYRRSLPGDIVGSVEEVAIGIIEVAGLDDIA